jgi:hypothetical protein
MTAMQNMLLALKDMIVPVESLINTLGTALFTAGIYMENGVLDLPVFSGPYQIAYQASGNNALMAEAIRDQVVANTDTMTAFFSGMGSPFIAQTGQMMQDTANIMMAVPGFLSSMIDWLSSLAEIDVLTSTVLSYM